MPTWVTVLLVIVAAVCTIRVLDMIIEQISFNQAVAKCKKKQGLAVVQNPDTRLWEAAPPPKIPDIRYNQPGMLMDMNGGSVQFIVETYGLNLKNL